MRLVRTLMVLVVAAAPLATVPADAWSGGQAVFRFTGRPQAWVVPKGVTSVHVDVQGAPGSWYGGRAGRVEADLAVRPGQRYLVHVGGQSYGEEGGWNGGGRGGRGCTMGWGGGGASDIRYGGATLKHRIVVAGGGGGGGPWNGGLGGDTVADDGRDGYLGDDNGGGGGGGMERRGGAGGVPDDAGSRGAAGTFGRGGAGAPAIQGQDSSCGNGGGGGWYGGGGGASGGTMSGGGGGGGSSYASRAFANVAHTLGYGHGRDGLVVIGWGTNEAPRAPKIRSPRRGSQTESKDLYFAITGDDPDWDNVVGEGEVVDVVTGLVIATFRIDSGGEELGQRSGEETYGSPGKLDDGHYRWRARTKDVNRYGGQWGPWTAAVPFVVGRGSPFCNNTAVLADC